MLATLLVKMIGPLPFLGPLFERTSGFSGILMAVSISALLSSVSILIVVELIVVMIPAVRLAARLGLGDPSRVNYSYRQEHRCRPNRWH